MISFLSSIWWILLALLAAVTIFNILIPAHKTKLQKAGFMLSVIALFLYGGHLALDFTLSTITNVSVGALKSAVPDEMKDEAESADEFFDEVFDESEEFALMKPSFIGCVGRLIFGIAAAVIAIICFAKRILTFPDSTAGAEGQLLGKMSIISYIGSVACFILAIVYLIYCYRSLGELSDVKIENLLATVLIFGILIVLFFLAAPVLISKMLIAVGGLTLSGFLVVLEPLTLLFSLSAGFYAFTVLASFAVSFGGMRRNTKGKLPYFLMMIASVVPVLNVVPCFAASKERTVRSAV